MPSLSDTKHKVDESKTVSQSHDGEVKNSLANGNSNTEIKIVIIDADSSDLRWMPSSCWSSLDN